MELPKYHLRIVSDDEAGVFRIGLNDQRRITWARCAAVSLQDGQITMLEGQPLPADLGAFCKAALATVKAAKDGDTAAFIALKAMGQLAEACNNLEQPMANDLFDMLIWTEADLKNGLVANKGLAMMSEDDQEKFILQGQQYMSEGKYDLAERSFLQALTRHANRVNVNNFLAIAYAKQGKLAEAATAINESLKSKTSNIGHILRGVQYNLSVDALEKAQEYIKDLAGNAALPSAQALQLSRFAMRAKMEETGLELVANLVKKGDGGEAALEHLANILAANSGEKAVFDVVRAHMAEMPELPRLKEWYLRCLIADGELERAEAAAKQWVAQDAGSAQGQFQLGRVHLAMQKPRRALRALEKAAELAPENAPCHKLIADAHLALNDLAGAAAASEIACRLAPDNKNFIAQSKRITEALMQPSAKGEGA